MLDNLPEATAQISVISQFFNGAADPVSSGGMLAMAGVFGTVYAVIGNSLSDGPKNTVKDSISYFFSYFFCGIGIAYLTVTALTFFSLLNVGFTNLTGMDWPNLSGVDGANRLYEVLGRVFSGGLIGAGSLYIGSGNAGKHIKGVFSKKEPK